MTSIVPGSLPLLRHRFYVLAIAVVSLIIVILGSTGVYVVYTGDSVSCILGSRDIYLLAVSRDNSGRYIGVATRAHIEMIPGEGVLFLSVEPMTQIDMQASLNIGALIASYVTGTDLSRYNILVRVVSDTPLIGGPSASGFLTAAIASLLVNKSLDNRVVMTGMIMPDGLIGPVGGIPQKLQAAIEIGAKTMLIPAGQRYSVDLNTGRTVDVVQEGRRLGIEVIEVASIYDALRRLGVSIPEPSPTEPRISPVVEKVFRELVSELNTTYSSIRGSISLAGVDPMIRGIVSSYISRAQNLSERALRESLEKDYYSAASDYFSAVIYIDTARWVIEIYNNTDRYRDLYQTIIRTLDNVSSVYRDIVSEVYDRGYIDLARLEVLNEIAYRVLEANNTIGSLPRPGTPYLTIENIYDAVYSLWRLYSVTTWLKLYNNISPTGLYISLEQLKRSSSLLINYVQTLYTYLSSLGIYVAGLSELSRLLDTAYRLYLSGDYIGANSQAIQLSALAASYLHVSFTTNITETLYTVRKIALEYLGRMRSLGYDISIPSLYITRGDSLANIDPGSAILFYELGISDAMWYIIFARGLTETTTTYMTPYTTLETTTVIVRASQTYVTTGERGITTVVLVMMTVVIIAETALLYRLYREKRYRQTS